MDEYGTLTIIRKWDTEADRYANRITHADRYIRVSREILNAGRAEPLGFIHLDGDVLTIRDDYGARFIYRIHWDDYADGGYLAEWPD